MLHSQAQLKQRMEKSKIEHQLQAEAAAFFHYLESEIDNANEISIASGRIFFQSQGQRYDYKKSGNRIVREINSSGHVEVCLYVKSFQARLVHRGIAVQLVLEKHNVQRQMETVVHYYLSRPEGGS